jgi:hypothetical protein
MIIIISLLLCAIYQDQYSGMEGLLPVPNKSNLGVCDSLTGSEGERPR